MVRRIDAAPIKRAEKTAVGFLRGEAFVTRTGVFTYRFADGSERRELRAPEEVFKADSLKSLALAPLTLDHPDGAVTPENAKALTVGHLGEDVARADQFVKASYLVTDAKAISDVEAKRKTHLSCGYDCDLELVSGMFDGQRYDAIQRNIRYNHAAIVASGRAGPEVSIRLDALDAICVDADDVEQADKQEGKTMTIKIRLDGIDFEVTEQVAQAFKARLDRAEAETAAKEAELKKLRADLDASNGRADALDADLKKVRADNAPEKIDAKIKARADLLSKASAVCGSDFKADGLSDDEIKRAVIVKVSPEVKLDGKSADYVAARFDAALESFEAGEGDDVDDTDRKDSLTAVRGTLANGTAKTTPDSARQKMIDRNRSLWAPKST